MSADSQHATPPMRSWHAPPPTAVVDHSRRVWRWLLSGLALLLVALGVYWAWPRPATKTVLLILRDDRAERNILPPVPSLHADVDALWQWAQAARVPALELPLSRLDTPQSLTQWLTSAIDRDVLRFSRQRGTPGTERLAPGDTLIVYIKAHGIAVHQPSAGQAALTPLLLKTLTEDDLATNWWTQDRYVLPLGPLLESLASLQDNPQLVILDAVHLTHDPRLGVVTNLLPHAVRQLAQRELEARRNFWLVVPGPGGEPSSTLPSTGRSVWMESMLAALTSRQAAVPLDQWLAAAHAQWRQHLVADQTVENRPPELVMAGAGTSVLRLPAWPPAEAPPPSRIEKAAEQTGKEVARMAASSADRAVSSVVGSNVPGAAQSVGQQATAVGPGKAASPLAAAGSQAGPSPSPDAKQDASASAASTSSTAPAGVAASTSPSASASGTQTPTQSADSSPVAQVVTDELALVWQIRDQLLGRWPQGLSPTCFAPDAWRRIEGILVGFEQRRFCNQTTAEDAATLHDLRLDLERLEAFLSGDRSAPPVGPCRPIAQSWEVLSQGEAGRSFQGRAGSGLDEANRALWTALHAGYRLGDYVRLECASSMLVDGGPSWEEPLEGLLRQLPRLRALLRPEGLAEGRLTDLRVAELSQAAEAVAAHVTELDDALARYVQQVADERAGCGRWLRTFVLLQSPLVTASGRAALRQSAVSGNAGAEPTASPPPLAASAQRQARLTRALAHLAGLLRTMAPARASSEASQAGASAPLAALAEEMEDLARRLEAVPATADPLLLAELGRQWQEMARHWPQRLQLAPAASSVSDVSDGLPAKLDRFWLTLAMDGRDSASWRRSLEKPLVPVQPLRPMRLVQRVTLATSADSPTWLAMPDSPGTPWTLTLDLTTEATPPYPVALELAFPRDDLELVWDATGQPVRPGANPLTLASSHEVLTLRAIPRRVETNPAAATTRVTATVRYGQAAPAQAVATFLLPRPDRVELLVARPSDDPQPRFTWEPQGELGGRVLLFPNRSRRLGLWVRNLASQEKRLVAQLYRVPAGLAGPGGRLFDPRGSGQLVAPLADLHAQLTRGEGPQPAALRGMLLAQSNPQEPLVLPPLGSRLVPLPLVAAGLPPPAASGAAPAASGASSGPEDAGIDVTAGLVLILTSPGGMQRPLVHWIELAVPDPDEWLAAQRPEQHEGALHVRVGLKDATLAGELGLESQPLSLVWDRRTLPDEVRERGPLARQLTADGRPVLFTTSLPPTLPWPLYLALHVDGYPRALLLRVDRTLDQLAMTNWKQNRPAAVAITGLRATAGRPGPQARTVAWAFWPPQPYLPLPNAPLGEGVVLRPAGTPLAVRVEEDAPQVRLEADLGAEIAPRYFAAGCQVRLEAAGQVQELATARQVRVVWRGVSEAGFELASEVGDWQRLPLGTWEVSEDQRIEVVARVIGPGGGPPPLPASDDRAVVIFDRTPPALRQLTAELLPTPLGVTTSLKPRVRFRCRADDGLGSGIDKVEFAAGFDALVKNSRLDPDERIGEALVVPASAASDGWFEATLELSGEVPPQPLLVEARALDRVGLASRTERASLVVHKPGGDRATFGQGKEKKGAAPKKLPENP